MDRSTLNAALRAARAQNGTRDPVLVGEEVSECGRGNGTPGGVCRSEWKSANGVYRAIDPLGEPCENELSSQVVSGRGSMRGIYSDCDFQLLISDVPNNDLGVIENFRDVVKALKLTQGTNRIISAAMADPVALSIVQATAEDGLPAVGVFLTFRFILSLTEAPVIRIVTSNFDPVFFGASVATVTQPNRDVTIGFNQSCTTAKLFLPFASKDVSSDIWAPRGARIQADNATASNNSTVTITGLPSSAGTVTAQFVSPTSPMLGPIAGAVNVNG